MDEKQIANIKKYLKIINPMVDKIEESNKDLIGFVIDEVSDRVQLYLNSETIPTKLERILANIVNNGLKRCLKNIELSSEDNTAVDQVVTSISDNGQSISYSNEITNYFTTASDNELFTGFESLLRRYRRVNVVYPKNNDK